MGLPTPMLVALSPTVPQFRYPLGAGWGPVFRGWNLSGTCLEIVWYLSGTCLEIVWNLSGTGLEIVWNLSGTCLGSAAEGRRAVLVCLELVG